MEKKQFRLWQFLYITYVWIHNKLFHNYYPYYFNSLAAVCDYLKFEEKPDLEKNIYVAMLLLGTGKLGGNLYQFLH